MSEWMDRAARTGSLVRDALVYLASLASYILLLLLPLSSHQSSFLDGSINRVS